MKKRLLCLLLAVLLLLPLSSCKEDTPPPLLEMHFLDVGQGDATLLRTLDGDILIDAGTDDTQDRLCLHLENLGVTSLLLAIFTHSDEDHIGGADGVLRKFPTETVWISEFFEDSECTRLLISAAVDTGAQIQTVSASSHRKIGDVALSVLSPMGSMDGASVNDKSLVLKLVCGEASALLMGDAESATEALLLEQYDHAQFNCDVLKLGHHGASTSSSEAFLNTVRPQYAVISCGAANYYGHPHGETLARLQSVGATVLRTDRLGDVVLMTDGKEIWQNE
ncbi:MAG: MBL fold metallo-hydrolase [Clostridia bacterium]|nr:MBL fold metallo-hydrolase [Clostridia bacterium]